MRAHDFPDGCPKGLFAGLAGCAFALALALMLTLTLTLTLTSAARAGDAAKPDAAKPDAPSPALDAAKLDGLSFEHDVRPIFKAYCLDCHGGGEVLKGKLDLRLARTARKGGKHGPAIVPGKPDSSRLLDRLLDEEMPPGEKKVPPDQIATIERWIAQGARTLHPEPESLPPGINITPEERAFWAFQPVTRPGPPPVAREDAALARTPIDAFLLARLRRRGTTFAPEADRRALARRAAFDLTGLPPTPAQLDTFLHDKAPGAYERMVDRLLASPHYGERWARHWLDSAGYADSEGDGGTDTKRAYAYKYRDYVIRAFNADKPLDQFIVEQLAGDELVPRPWKNLAPDAIEKLIATGFLRTAVDGTASGGADVPMAANQVVGDTIKIVSSTFLGLTVGCAQCHDHRYDPVPQADYYRLRAVFEPALDPAHWRRPGSRLVSLYTDAERAQAAEIEAKARKMDEETNALARKFLDEAFEKELTKFPEALRGPLREAYKTPKGKRNAEQKQLLAAHPSADLSPGVLYQYNPKAADTLKKKHEESAAVRAKKPPEDFISVLDEQPGVVPQTHLFHRGDYRQPGRPVAPGGLTVLASSSSGGRFDVPLKNADLPTSGRRLAYARHLVDGRHPLVGRVLVNRIWLRHFGRGLVDTPGDFGVLGNRPTHPQLLDWLADELVRQGWHLKALHRMIVTSAAYRQSSTRAPGQPSSDVIDADYGRFPLLRLDAESLRDGLLAVSGQLDARMYGPPVPVVEDKLGQALPDAGRGPRRRSIYLEARRSMPVSLLVAFDAPVMAVNCERRAPSTSAPQALMLMNSQFVLDRAQALAQRLRAERPAPADASAQIELAWRLVYGRPVTAEEAEAARAFLQDELKELDQAKAPGDHALSALTNLCQQLISSNEFLYR